MSNDIFNGELGDTYDGASAITSLKELSSKKVTKFYSSAGAKVPTFEQFLAVQAFNSVTRVNHI